ncbi:EpsG family protein [Bifidobacterium longum]|uniref:EpsG family protein n=1 Tax=Bifidobacterium longum TaxID=216816 RepID=UPI001D02DF38|nr:EpsG family protein [Bifidobacterium longum]
MCVADKMSKKARVLPFVITFLILFTVSGFRYGVGTDYFFTYVPTYKQIYNGTPPPMEPIFKWLNGLCIDFAGSWYQSIFIVTSFIFIGLVYIAIYNMPCSKALLTVSFLCGGYFLLSLNVVRQTIATALFCCALFLVKRNMDGEKQLQSLFEAFSLVAIAVGFHYSAIIYFAVIPLLYLKLDRKIYLSLFAFFAVLVPTFVAVIGILLKGTKYGNYISGYYLDSGKAFSLSSLLFVGFFFVYLFTKSKEGDHWFTVFRNLHFVGSIAIMIGLSIPLGQRVSALFYLLNFLSIPYYLEYYVAGRKKIFAKISYFSLCLFIFLHTLSVNGNGVLPYNFAI